MVALFVLLLGAITGIPAPVYESRESVPEPYKWDLSRFYGGWVEWEAELEEVQRLYDRLAAYEGRLEEGPEILLEVMRLSDRAGEMAGRLFGYAAKVRDLDRSGRLDVSVAIRNRPP
jgi:oligoendopeptidase F